MRSSIQLCGFLLYVLLSTSSAQLEEVTSLPERKWHSTTPNPLVSLSSQPSSTEKPTKEEETVVEATTSDPYTGIPEVLKKLMIKNETKEKDPLEELILTEITNQNKPEPKEKQRNWMSVPGKELEQEAPLPVAPEKEPKQELQIPSNPELPSEEKISPVDITEEILQALDKTVVPEEGETVDEYTMNKTDFELPKNISDMLAAAEDGEELVQETVITKKTTVYVTISDGLAEREPVFVNLTGIRDFTGIERRLVSGCLDLSDLELNGEEAGEVIQRMSKHKFHRLDLSNNKISEFPTNTFSPVAFSVRELRLNGNPLLSNGQGEGSVLQRGGLFHLTELRELNISGCGLKDIDFFTPWNSNRLEMVDLSANNLPSVPSNLQFFHKLKKLYLDGNPITQVTELPFALLWNVQMLSLSGCIIHTITSDPFRNMEHLKQLSLEGNNLTRIGDLRLPRGSSGVKMYLSGNPWHCACDMLNFVEYHHYAIRDIEEIRCATPRWLEGLRTAYLTKEILSLDSIEGDCNPTRFELAASTTHAKTMYAVVRTDRLEAISLVIFALAAVFMMVHILWGKKSPKDKYKFEDELRPDINYIRIDRKPSFIK